MSKTEKFIEIVTVFCLVTGTPFGYLVFAFLWMDKDLEYAYEQFAKLVRRAMSFKNTSKKVTKNEPTA